MFHPKEKIAARTKKFNLEDPPPRLLVSEPQTLPEMDEEAHHTKQSQEFGHLLITRVLHPDYIRN